MIWVLLGIIALFALVLCVLGAKTWYVWHVVLLFFVSMAGAGLMILAAMSLKTHEAWQSRYNQLSAHVESEKATIYRLTRGDILSDSPELVSLPGVTGELERELVDRGRVWRGVAPINVEGNTITLNMENWGDTRCFRVGMQDDEFELEPEPVADGDNAAPAAAVPPHRIEKSMVLHVFQEKSLSEFDAETRAVLFDNGELPEKDTEGYCKLPSFYLGEYKVIDAGPDSLSIEPLLQLDPAQNQAIQDSQGTTWVLYELMPLDSHEVFDRATEEQLRTLIPAEQTGLAADKYDDLMGQYVRDLQPAGPGDPDERTRTKVRFLQQHTIDVDVEQGDGGAEKAFDLSGRAQLPQLRLGQAVEFKKGDEAYFDTKTAKRLVDDEAKAELTEDPPLYVRPLQDYAYVFRETQFETDRLAEKIKTLEVETADIVAAAEQAKSHIAYRNAEKTKLESDLANFKRESAAVVRFLQELKTKRDEQKQLLKRYYQANQVRERRLRSGQARP